MKFCPNCNNQLDDSAVVCNYCGMQLSQQEYQQYPQQGYQQQYQQYPQQGGYVQQPQYQQPQYGSYPQEGYAQPLQAQQPVNPYPPRRSRVNRT